MEKADQILKLRLKPIDTRLFGQISPAVHLGWRLWVNADQDIRASMERFAYWYASKSRANHAERAEIVEIYVERGLIDDAVKLSNYHQAAHGARLFAYISKWKFGDSRAQLSAARIAWTAVTVPSDVCADIGYALNCPLKMQLQAAVTYWRALPEAEREEFRQAYDYTGRRHGLGTMQTKLSGADWQLVHDLGLGNRSKGARLLLDCLAQGIKKAP